MTMTTWLKGVGARTSRARKLNIAMAVVGMMLALMKASNLEAQSGCTHTKSIYCGGSGHCTTEAGNNCVTC
jgi:hypothetical protein